MDAEEPEPDDKEEEVKSSIISWSEVYGVRTCGGCGKADCPNCTKNFLNYLNHKGQQPKGFGPQ